MLQTVGHSYAMVNAIEEVKGISLHQSKNMVETLAALINNDWK